MCESIKGADRRKSPKGLFRRKLSPAKACAVALRILPAAKCTLRALASGVTKAKPLSSTLARIEVFFAPAEPRQKTYFNSHFPSENDFFDKLRP